MFGLHFFLNVNNIFFFSLFFFFVIFSFAIIDLNKTFFFTNYQKTNFSFFFLFFFLITLFFFFKFYFNFYIQQLIRFDFEWVSYSNTISDTLVVLSLLVSYYSWIYLSEKYLAKQTHLVFFLLIFFFSTLIMVYSTNILIMFLFFEFIFVPSLFFAIKLSYSKKAEKTIEFLLLWTFTGTMLCLGALGFLFFISKTFDIYYILNVNFTKTEQTLFYLIFFLGFGVKIPVWPFYFWLTKVHVEAPTGFSMFLSGYLVKTALFCFFQISILLNSNSAVLLCLCLLILGFLDASLRMWAVFDVKRLIALATVQEMNMILIFLLSSSLYFLHVFNNFLLTHGLMSVLFFYLVDLVYKQTLTRNIFKLSGLSFNSFKFVIFVWLSLLIFRGFPLFVKFFIEWEFLQLLMLNFNFLGFFLFLIASLFSVTAFFKHWVGALYGTPNLFFYNYFLNKDFYLGFSMLCGLFVSTFIFYLC